MHSASGEQGQVRAEEDARPEGRVNPVRDAVSVSGRLALPLPRGAPAGEQLLTSPGQAGGTDAQDTHRPRDSFSAGAAEAKQRGQAPKLGTPLLGSCLPLAHSLKVTAPRGD